MGYSQEQIEMMRRQADEYEAHAAQDADMENQVVFAMRPANVDKELMIALFGEDWLLKHLMKKCSLCQTPVIVRPVFERAVHVCIGCVPKFREEMQRPRSIN